VQQQAPHSAAAAATTVNKEMTRLPASKKICYAHNDDEKSLKNLITQETSINLHNVSEQVCSCIFIIHMVIKISSYGPLMFNFG
jgi:hypothetical protein